MKKIDFLMLTIVTVLTMLLVIGWIDNETDLYWAGLMGLIGMFTGFMYGDKTQPKK